MSVTVNGRGGAEAVAVPSRANCYWCQTVMAPHCNLGEGAVSGRNWRAIARSGTSRNFCPYWRRRCRWRVERRRSPVVQSLLVAGVEGALVRFRVCKGPDRGGVNLDLMKTLLSFKSLSPRRHKDWVSVRRKSDGRIKIMTLVWFFQVISLCVVTRCLATWTVWRLCRPSVMTGDGMVSVPGCLSYPDCWCRWL